MHTIWESALFAEDPGGIDPEDGASGDEEEIDKAKTRNDDTQGEEYPQNDEDVLVSDVLADLANHLVSIREI